MGFLIILVSVVLAINAATDKELWSEFKKNHERGYRNLREEKVRFTIFQRNLRKIEEHNEKYNKGEKSYYLGITPYSDMSREEFISMLNYSKDTKPFTHSHVLADRMVNVVVPDTVNWVEKGAVTEVKNQGQCGSCWAFSTTGALEGAHFFKNGSLVSLSEQNLMDCTTWYGNAGCNGGRMEFAYQYVRNRGIQQEKDYPYEGILGPCHFDKTRSVLKVWQYMGLPNGREPILQYAVATSGPVSAAVDASFFQQYAGGVFDEPYCTDDELNHGVLVVGYGTTDEGVDYWLIKNSWGASWGEQGYIRLLRNKGNRCGVASDATYPILM